MKTLHYTDLVKQNWRHINKVNEMSLNSKEHKQVMAKRLRHIRDVRNSMPTLARILDPKRKIKLKIPGEKRTYSLMGTGFSGKNVPRKITLVLDPKGKGILFFKSKSKDPQKAGKWFPFKSITMAYGITKSATPHLWLEKYPGHPEVDDIYLEIGEAIEKHEKNINFIQSAGINEINRLKDFLGE